MLVRKQVWETIPESRRLNQESHQHIFFHRKHKVPANRVKDVTYCKFVCSGRDQKKKTNHTRAVLGGNLVHFPGNVGTPTADMLLVKILLNSVVSTPGAKFIAINISKFYLNTPMTLLKSFTLTRG